MKRLPVQHRSTPAYPQHSPRSWAMGLLALGGAVIASGALTGCSGVLPRIGHSLGNGQGIHATPGDIPMPVPPPATADPAKLLIPELDEQHVLGDMPAIEGDVAMPELQPEEVVEELPEPDIPWQHRIAGGMPAPRLPPAPVEDGY